MWNECSKWFVLDFQVFVTLEIWGFVISMFRTWVDGECDEKHKGFVELVYHWHLQFNSGYV
jgi:hypothetical protein